jgi:hypothetical protein
VELDDFWSLTIKTVSYNASASTKILTVLLRFALHNKTREGGTECDVFCFFREAETVGLGKMS